MNATTASSNNGIDPVTGTPVVNPTPRVLAYSHFAVATDLSPSSSDDASADGAITFSLLGPSLPSSSIKVANTAATYLGPALDPQGVNIGISFSKSATQVLDAASLSPITFEDASSSVQATFPRGFLVGPTDVVPDPTPSDPPDTAKGEVSQALFDHVKIFMRSRISGGCGGGKYCPNSAVTRAQMAVFLLVAEHGPGYQPPAATGNVFWDVPASSFAAAWIEQLERERITAGCGAPDPTHGGMPPFCPGSNVTRQEMAVFILVALMGPTYTPPAMTTPIFADVPSGTTFGPWIEDLYRRGITGGCSLNPLKYCPNSNVTRMQMAIFLNTAFKLQCGTTNGCASDGQGRDSNYPTTVDGVYP